MSIFTLIIIFIVSILLGLLSKRTVNRFWECKIDQFSWEYCLCGMFAALMSLFGIIISVGLFLQGIVDRIFLD